MDTIKINSKGLSVERLQALLPLYGFSVQATGVFDDSTHEAVVNFQKRFGLDADGIVGYRSWEALLFSNRAEDKNLTENDFKLAAQLLDVETAALKAVKEVESGRNGGFLPSGRPAILFEGHIFWSQLKKKGINPETYVKGNENILYPKWDKSHYKSGEAEYDRLNQARNINREAAEASASWGMFQIMGFNHAACGERTVAGFVEMMGKSELHQLLLSARFIKSAGMLPALRQKNWAEFARLYNGPRYAENRYDAKLQKAYMSFSK